MGQILGTGIATLDIINTLDHYPAEDSETRAINQRIRRGGNVTNTLTILSQLGHHCAWAGTLADEPDGDYILRELHTYDIDTSHCHTVIKGKTPTSYIIQNRQNGSRTIVHYRDLPELGFSDFKKIDLSQFDWLHFEGRNVQETRKMLKHAQSDYPDIPRSIEIEKSRPHIESLFEFGNLLLFSKQYVKQVSDKGPVTFLKDHHLIFTQARLVYTDGENGALAVDKNGEAYHCPASPPVTIRDTLGAGDTFNAGIIDACLRNLDMNKALESACQLAGEKCAHEGLGFLTT